MCLDISKPFKVISFLTHNIVNTQKQTHTKKKEELIKCKRLDKQIWKEKQFIYLLYLPLNYIDG